MTELTYLYCIVPAEAPLPAFKELGEVRAIREGRLIALVATVARDARVASKAELERLARAHHKVAQLLLAYCTPLPLRLGTTLGSDDEVRALLRRGQVALLQALAAFEQRHEWGMKLYVEHAALESHLAPDTPGAQTLQALMRYAPTGVRYLLGKRNRRALTQARDQWIEGAVDRLARLLADYADQWVALKCYQGETWNAAALIHGSAETAFFDAVEQCADGLMGDAALKVTGPWAPYSFAPTMNIDPA
jgi:hypothetical protein